MKTYRLIFAVLFVALISGGCDLAKPQNPQGLAPASETPSQPAPVPPAKAAVTEKDVDASLQLDRTFEDKDFGFRFSYPSSCPMEKGEGFVGSGRLTLWFSPKQKIDSDAALMTVKWMFEEKQYPNNDRATISRAVKDNGGSLKAYEKVMLGGKEVTYIKVAFGGMMDPLGSRISEQYLTKVQKGSDLVINFTGPAKQFESYRPRFNAVLNSFQFDKDTPDSE